MKRKNFLIVLVISILAIILLENQIVLAQEANINISLGDTPKEYGGSIKLMLVLTVLTLLPSFLILMSCFTRIAVVLSFFKTAVGAQQAIPSQVLVGLALFTTIFVMAPVVTDINENALEPYMNNEITQDVAIEKGTAPIRNFMLKETRKKDLELFVDMSKMDKTNLTRENIPLTVVVPAFIISELKTAFEIGFLIYIPFLIIDMVVASVLMSMGMMMLPPVMISLPFKLLLFVMVDGWHLLIKSLVLSFM
ncbi:MAG: flagellar type III secretion system pore protein FliP [Sarcina sp.]